MKSRIPDEQDLHAWVDGQLDEERKKWVEHYLQQHPERAAQVKKWPGRCPAFTSFAGRICAAGFCPCFGSTASTEANPAHSPVAFSRCF